MDSFLDRMGYDVHPQEVQAMIRTNFDHGVAQIRVPGTPVEPVPLFKASGQPPQFALGKRDGRREREQF